MREKYYPVAFIYNILLLFYYFLFTLIQRLFLKAFYCRNYLEWEWCDFYFGRCVLFY